MEFFQRRRRESSLLAAACTHAQPTSELAQLLPQRPVLIVVPNAAGGPSDIAARLIAPRLAEVVKQNFIVDNRASANGVIGTDYVAKATPNGTFCRSAIPARTPSTARSTKSRCTIRCVISPPWHR